MSDRRHCATAIHHSTSHQKPCRPSCTPYTGNTRWLKNARTRLWLSTSHFQNNKWMCFILLFMLWTVYCIMCILYRVFLLYHMPLLYVVYVLQIQLLGCHSCNKRLSYKRLSCNLAISDFSCLCRWRSTAWSSGTNCRSWRRLWTSCLKLLPRFRAILCRW